jgi:predicted 3-demethylubiquinone-9 3-methyltransferase (glyoxalase superfamily)
MSLVVPGRLRMQRVSSVRKEAEMHKITPHLWFDREAVEAAEFYSSMFPNSKITDMTTIFDTPSGDVDIVSFEVLGHPFTAISAGPLFQFNPAVSFLVSCDTVDEVDALWGRLADGGTPLMPLADYPFSERYGWTEDKYGLSWQIMKAAERESAQRVIPTLMFVGAVSGKAEEAIAFYTSLFPNSEIAHILRYGPDEEPDLEGTVKHAGFTLAGQEFAAMDSAHDHDFAFNEAISFLVSCDTQEEIDHYWDNLSAVPRPNSAAGSRTATASRGRSYQPAWTRCSARARESRSDGSPRPS